MRQHHCNRPRLTYSHLRHVGPSHLQVDLTPAHMCASFWLKTTLWSSFFPKSWKKFETRLRRSGDFVARVPEAYFRSARSYVLIFLNKTLIFPPYPEIVNISDQAVQRCTSDRISSQASIFQDLGKKTVIKTLSNKKCSGKEKKLWS